MIVIKYELLRREKMRLFFHNRKKKKLEVEEMIYIYMLRWLTRIKGEMRK